MLPGGIADAAGAPVQRGRASGESCCPEIGQRQSAARIRSLDDPFGRLSLASAPLRGGKRHMSGLVHDGEGKPVVADITHFRRDDITGLDRKVEYAIAELRIHLE